MGYNIGISWVLLFSTIQRLIQKLLYSIIRHFSGISWICPFRDVRLVLMGSLLVGGFNPLKNISQIGSFPQDRGENKQYFKPPPRLVFICGKIRRPLTDLTAWEHPIWKTWFKTWTRTQQCQMSNEKNPYYFPLNPGWFMGILILVYNTPHITG